MVATLEPNLVRKPAFGRHVLGAFFVHVVFRLFFFETRKYYGTPPKKCRPDGWTGFRTKLGSGVATTSNPSHKPSSNVSVHTSTLPPPTKFRGVYLLLIQLSGTNGCRRRTSSSRTSCIYCGHWSSALIRFQASFLSESTAQRTAPGRGARSHGSFNLPNPAAQNR